MIGDRRGGRERGVAVRPPRFTVPRPALAPTSGALARTPSASASTSATPHRPRMRRAHGDGDRNVSDRDRSCKNSRARMITPTVAASMKSTPLRSITTSVPSRAIAAASNAASAGAVDMSYSPRRQTRSRSAADSSYAPRRRRGADTREGLNGSHGLSWHRALHDALPGSGAPLPSRPTPTRHVRVLVVSCSTYTRAPNGPPAGPPVRRVPAGVCPEPGLGTPHATRLQALVAPRSATKQEPAVLVLRT